MTAMNTLSFTSSEIYQTAEQNARQMGISVNEYVSRLVLKDTPPARKKIEIFPVEHGWGPVPKHVQEQWEKDIQAFEKEEQRHSHPAAFSAAELVTLLNTDEAD